MKKITRKEFMGDLSIISAGLMLSGLSGCKNLFSSSRSIFVKGAIDWEPRRLIRDVAFRVVSPLNYAMDYIDFGINSKNSYYRLFMTALDVVDLAVSFYCPGCSVGHRVTVLLAKSMFNSLVNAGITYALALPESGGYRLHNIAPFEGLGGRTSVVRSAICGDIRSFEPSGIFNKKIPVIPDKINYFTKVSALNGESYVYHNWYRNGQQTDQIRLDLGRETYRTHSRKRNLGFGQWIVSTTTPRGEVLDVQEFSIGSNSILSV